MKELNMSRVRHAAFAVALFAAVPVYAQSAAQAGAPTESLTDLLLKQAQTALDAFDRPNAEKFARQILEQMTTSTTAQKERARIILANVYYPEEAPNERKRAQALAVLKDAVRENFDLTIDRTLTWVGIDSILVEAKATTFGLAAGPATPQQDGVGPAGHVDFTARASRPSNFRLSIRGPQTTAVFSDTSGGTEATLQLPTMRNERPIYTSGEYEITIVAVDRASGDTVSARFTANVSAPALTFVTVPVALDSSRILSERTKKYGWKGLIVGGLVAGSIFSFSNTHADTTLKAKVGADSKGAGIAALAGVTIIAASFMDRGRPIPNAIAANQRLRDDFATSIRNAQAENANRIATHKTTFVITPGGR
jgi:hypothetical protein